jgi:hypothetical protein
MVICRSLFASRLADASQPTFHRIPGDCAARIALLSVFDNGKCRVHHNVRNQPFSAAEALERAAVAALKRTFAVVACLI